MRAIETEFRGYRFRSRLEARWAVFFETLGLQWEYEPQGFDIDGIRYLPDFRVKTPQGEDIWYEVKPRGVDSDPKFDAFSAQLYDNRVVLLAGDPVDVLGSMDICPRCGVFAGDERVRLQGVMVAGGASYEEYALMCYPCDGETPSGGPHPTEPGFLGAPVAPHKGDVLIRRDLWDYRMNRKILPAAKKARGARFEHGENGL